MDMAGITWMVLILAYMKSVMCCSDIVGIKTIETSQDILITAASHMGNSIPMYSPTSQSFESSNVFSSKHFQPLKPKYQYFDNGKVRQAVKYSGWPLTPVIFHHPVQSPVDIITNKAVTLDLNVLDIIESDLHGVQATLLNSGHTVFVYIKEDPTERPYLKGGPLKQKYIFEQMHFHWGREDIWGSEHFVDGESFAAEIHLVHYNSKYATFEKAALKPDGLAVLTVFAEASSVNNTLLQPLEYLLPNISDAGSQVMLDSTEAMQWPTSALGTNKEYYTYPGSLTTKPFTENVIFIILPQPIELSFEQLRAFRSLHSDDHGGRILDNKRQLQPLHNRPIVRSTHLQ